MAQELEGNSAESTDLPELALAVQAIAMSPPLRLFFRRYLALCGLLPLSPAFAPDPLEMARRAGMQQAGLELVRMLSAADPLLWPTLQIEDGQDE